MSCKHLVKRKNSSVYHYRIIAPTDLKSVLTLVSMSKRTGMTISQVTDEVLYTGLIEMQELDDPE